LSGADLRGADLSGCDLGGAALRGADLRGARLDSAVLYGADLNRAWLDGARLLGADLRAAVLAGTRWRRAALVGARFDEGALAGRDTFGAAMPDSASTAEPQTSPGHALHRKMTFSPDETLLASGGTDGGVWLWEAGSWQLVRRLDGPAGWVRAIAFSPDSTLLASGGDDGTLWVWDLDSGAGREIADGLSFVRSVAFSPDGAHLITAGDDGVIRAWAAGSGWLMREVARYGVPMYSTAFNRDGTVLAVSGRDGVVRLYSVPSWRLAQEFTSELRSVVKLHFNAAGHLEAKGRNLSGHKEVFPTWRVRDWQELQRSEYSVEFDFDGVNVSASAYTPGWRMSVTGFTDGLVMAEIDGKRTKLRRVDVSVHSVALDAAGTVLVACGQADSARPGVWRWQLDAVRGDVWPAPRPMADPGEELRSVVVNPAGTMVAACFGRTVFVWETGSGRVLTRLTHQGWVHSVAFSPDGSVFATHGETGIRRWETEQWEPLAPYSPRDPATGKGMDLLVWPVLGFGRDGMVLAAGQDFNGLVMWRGGGRSYLRAPGIGVEKCPVAFGADGTLVAVGVEGAILLWDLTTGLVRHRIEGYRGTVNAVGFDADTTMVAGVGEDRVVRVWDVATGRFTQSLVGHTNVVQDLAFGPGGMLVSGGNDGVRVWDLKTGSCRAHLISGIDGAAWAAIGLCRFELGELDRFRALRTGRRPR
jgi:WD40 repeat protein